MTTTTPFTADEIRAASSIKKAQDMIRANLAANPSWLLRGLIAIYNRQTADEQSAEQTTEHNTIGFNGLDAKLLTSFAKQVIDWNATPAQSRRFAAPLSPKQLDWTQRKMLKYSGQLARIVRETTPAVNAAA